MCIESLYLPPYSAAFHEVCADSNSMKLLIKSSLYPLCLYDKCFSYSGRSSGFRINLLTTSSRLLSIRQWHHAIFVPGYSGGPVPDFHRIPYYASIHTMKHPCIPVHLNTIFLEFMILRGHSVTRFNDINHIVENNIYLEKWLRNLLKAIKTSHFGCRRYISSQCTTRLGSV